MTVVPTNLLAPSPTRRPTEEKIGLGVGLTVSALGLLAPVGGWFYWRRRRQRPLLHQQGGDEAAGYAFTKPELHAEEATAVADAKMET
jgi:hypothetical protein